MLKVSGQVEQHHMRSGRSRLRNKTVGCNGLKIKSKDSKILRRHVCLVHNFQFPVIYSAFTNPPRRSVIYNWYPEQTADFKAKQYVLSSVLLALKDLNFFINSFRSLSTAQIFCPSTPGCALFHSFYLYGRLI